MKPELAAFPPAIAATVALANLITASVEQSE